MHLLKENVPLYYARVDTNILISGHRFLALQKLDMGYPKC